MNEKERDTYLKMVEDHRNRFVVNDNWTQAMSKLIVYKEPHFTSVGHIKYVSTKDLHVAANFIGCGK